MTVSLLLVSYTFTKKNIPSLENFFPTFPLQLPFHRHTVIFYKVRGTLTIYTAFFFVLSIRNSQLVIVFFFTKNTRH